jgi:hypothetical protein
MQIVGGMFYPGFFLSPSFFLGKHNMKKNLTLSLALLFMSIGMISSVTAACPPIICFVGPLGLEPVIEHCHQDFKVKVECKLTDKERYQGDWSCSAADC